MIRQISMPAAFLCMSNKAHKSATLLFKLFISFFFFAYFFIIPHCDLSSFDIRDPKSRSKPKIWISMETHPPHRITSLYICVLTKNPTPLHTRWHHSVCKTDYSNISFCVDYGAICQTQNVKIRCRARLLRKGIKHSFVCQKHNASLFVARCAVLLFECV